jgi:hypothetical protein
MKKLIALLAGLAIAGAAWAKVDPTRPMVTGHGNVTTSPQKVIVTNQTAATPAAPANGSSDAVLKLDKFEVTGSLLPHAPAKVTPAPKRK